MSEHHAIEVMFYLDYATAGYAADFNGERIGDFTAHHMVEDRTGLGFKMWKRRMFSKAREIEEEHLR